MIKRIFYAPGIHQGGGESLLYPLLAELKNDKNIIFILDERLRLSHRLPFLKRVIYVPENLFSKLIFEWHLRILIKEEMEVLCFGSLPPLWAHRGKQIVFVHNCYFINDLGLNNLPLSGHMRVRILRWWLSSRERYVKHFVVQTPSMQRLLRDALGREGEVLPFAALPAKKENIDDSDNKKLYDFLYVASGEPHKNHRQLILAWVRLAKKKKFPELCLTLDEKSFPKLCSWIVSMVEKHRLHVTMTGVLSQIEIQHLYLTSRALIYPSLVESFGLPVLEAVSAGLPVLAADTDYVKDVVHPTAVFNPHSSQSIAQAVLDFSYEPASFAIDLLNAKEFLSAVFTKDLE